MFLSDLEVKKRRLHKLVDLFYKFIMVFSFELIMILAFVYFG